MIFDPQGGAFAPPVHQGRPSKPFTHSDAHIEALLTVKLLLRLSLRVAERLALGMARNARAHWLTPNYSTLSRREGKLNVDLGGALVPGKKRVLIVDSTGLKVFGEGEWKVDTAASDVVELAAKGGDLAREGYAAAVARFCGGRLAKCAKRWRPTCLPAA